MKKIIICLLIIFLTVSAYSANNEILIGKELFSASATKIPSYFSDSFLKAVPAEKISSILRVYTDKLGILINIKGSNSSYDLIFEKGTAPCRIYLDKNNKISGFWLGQYIISNDSFDSIIDEFKTLENDHCAVSLCVMKNGIEVLHSYNSKRPLAVGSAFKLYVLKTLDNSIQKESDLAQVVYLSENNRSYPGATIYNWPDNTPLTLKSLANFMISVSDNTATDILIDHLGRQSVESFTPESCWPLLKTVEAFNLKFSLKDEFVRKYIASSLETKYKLLKTDLVSQKNNNIKFYQEPRYINEIEWHISTQDLCRVIYELRNNSSIYINPGLAQKEKWHKAGYKGGSEPGVLNYTHLLQKNFNSPVYSVSITINNLKESVDTKKFNDITARLIDIIDKM